MRAVESPQCATVKAQENKQSDFPIVALEMLTQRVPQIHCDYLQPHTTNTDSKTSPLALLAATCSSIGRTETEKTKESNTKSFSPKTTTQTEDLKSSFKPYKQDFKFAPFSKSFSDVITTSSTTATPYGYSFCQGRFPNGLVQSDMEKERNGNCAAPQYFDSSNREMNVHSMLKCHPGSNLTMPKTSPYMTHEHECTHCNAMRAASMPMNAQAASAAARGTTACPCGLCSQMRGHSETSALKQSSQICQYQSINPVYSNLKSSGTVCRDPHCQNCVGKFPQHGTMGLQNYIHPALIHQCTHGARPGQLSLPSAGSPTGLMSDAYLKAKPPSSAHPFICNWVAEGKHCGKSFISSEELLQHLRSHTSLMHAQNQNQTPCGTQEAVPIPHQLQQSSCNVHGCPCRLGKSSGRPTSLPTPYNPYPAAGSSSSLRYHPYGGLGPVSNAGASYSYLPHGMLHY